jgi:hypothetical protein
VAAEHLPLIGGWGPRVKIQRHTKGFQRIPERVILRLVKIVALRMVVDERSRRGRTVV